MPAAVRDFRHEAYEATLHAVAPEIPVERVRVAEFLGGSLDSPEAVDSAVEGLRQHLLKLVAEGARIVFE